MKKQKTVHMSMEDVYEQTGFCKRLPDEPEQQPLLEMPEAVRSPREAQTMADLMTPFQGEEIRDLCKQLKTKPAIETAAMFGDDVSFYQLHRNSAKALAIRLRNCLEAQQ